MASPLTPAELETFARRLQVLRDSYLDTGSSGSESTCSKRPAAGQPSESELMSADAAERRAVAMRRIEAALRRIALGEYGFCAACHGPIERRRLKIDPAASHCGSCIPPHP